jgi:hypothetical protein
LPIVGERGCRAATATGDARGDIAPAIVAGPVGLRFTAGGRAGGAGRIETGQLMGLAAVAVEVLVGASAIVGTLPELTQVRVDILVAVGGSAEAVGGRTRATGTVAGPLLIS